MIVTNFDQHHRRMLDQTIFVVWPCTGFEKHCLWREWIKERAQFEFEQGNPGMTTHYGPRLRMFATVWFDRFDDRVVAFVEPGPVFDHAELEKHLTAIFGHVPKWDGGHRAPFCNPMNFHLCVDALGEMSRGASSSGSGGGQTNAK